MRRGNRVVFAALAAATAVLLAGGSARATWTTVTVDMESADGKPEVVKGTALAYGWYIREFTPKAVKDRLQTDKKRIVFQDRDVVIRDLRSIEFEHEFDKTAGTRVPVAIHISYVRPGTSEIVKVDRKVADLQGFGGPKPILFVVTTPEGDRQLEVTPPLDDEGRKNFHPIVRVVFE